MIARNVEEFHLCYFKGELEEKSIIFHHFKFPKIIQSSTLLLALPTALKAFKICREYGINLIYILDGSYYELSGLLASRLLRIPLVIRLRQHEVRLRQIQHQNILRRTLANFITKLAITKAKRVVSISHELRDFALRWGASPSKVAIIYHGVDSNVFKPMRVKKQFPKIALFVGGLSIRKGIFVLLEAAKHLEDIHFFIIGPKSDNIKTSIPKNVHYLGIVKDGTMPNYYNMSDIVVLPSFVEGSPDTILEAFACCKPVIASKIAEMPWIVLPEFGWLVKPGNVQHLVEVIKNAFSDMKRLEVMGEAAREYVAKNFQWESYAREMTNILKASYD
jgi:glycosyltransferase involved in cell wall biosynthesis